MYISTDFLTQNPIITSTKGSPIESAAMPFETQAPLSMQRHFAMRLNSSLQELSKSVGKSVTVTQSYTLHDPIDVSNDVELAAVAVRGDGTAVSPYVLERWNITTNGTHGISITGTTAHFIIQNCWIMTGRVQDIHGINIASVASGTTLISNNFCQNNAHGISLENSEKVILKNNICSQIKRGGLHEGVGITLKSSNYAMIVNNICSDNEDMGIHLNGSDHSMLLNNTCSDNWSAGIRLDGSDHSMLVNNSCNHQTAISWETGGGGRGRWYLSYRFLEYNS